MATFFDNENELVNFYTIGEIIKDEPKLTITYVCEGGRRIERKFDTQDDYDQALSEINNAGSGGGGGGDGTLTKDITANVNVGGITSGRKFNSGTPFTTLWEALLVAYKNPTITLSSNLSTFIYKKGTLLDVNLTATATKGTSNIQTTVIKDGNTTVATSSTNSVSYQVTELGSDKTYKATVVDAQGKSGDSNTISISFVNPFYYGVAPDGLTDFDSLTEKLDKKSSQTISFEASPTNKGFYYFAYDKSYGLVTSILDSKGEDNSGNFRDPIVLTIEGVDYYVYQSKVIQGTSVSIQFNF